MMDAVEKRAELAEREAEAKKVAVKDNGHSDAVPPPIPVFRTVEPAQLPQGFLQRVDYVLRHPDALNESLRRDDDLWALARVFFAVTIVMAGIYGAVMGGTNWFQASPTPFSTDALFMIASAVKVPLLFLLTLLIVLPPIYVSSTFVGARASFSQMTTLLLASLAITSVVLASTASVSFFFALSTRSYDFMKLLHVAFFSYAGIVGVLYLIRGFRAISGDGSGRTPRFLFVGWIVLYMFVGTQLGWVMRPFIGHPDLEFQLFRPHEGNFYENVFQSLDIYLFGEDIDWINLD